MRGMVTALGLKGILGFLSSILLLSVSQTRSDAGGSHQTKRRSPAHFETQLKKKRTQQRRSFKIRECTLNRSGKSKRPRVRTLAELRNLNKEHRGKKTFDFSEQGNYIDLREQLRKKPTIWEMALRT
eukprot:gb/GEZJ01003325.1/.p2 GENE.gb/GEZJ01003325.1/~~gb/GEZJ01003325.1/.p2  ORF type:complete len:127 (-),score=18.20 gb/GEZJ01003325.1/:876-1256(-)